jgi:hypothetical protein
LGQDGDRRRARGGQEEGKRRAIFLMIYVILT